MSFVWRMNILLMQCLILLSVFIAILGKGFVNLAFFLVFKPRTQKLDSLRNCTNVVYVM